MVPARTILVVDDNPVVRAALGAYFEGLELMKVCAEADDGFEAIQKAKLHHPDLILMDLSMPNMNGIEAASVIKTEVPGSRIVVFTMFTDALGTALARAAGVDLVLPKSKGVRALMESIQEFLSDGPSKAEQLLRNKIS
jgi:two-component system nitrate/nitrite response regulator NarL